MSMSTGDVRRPNKLSAKAAATDPPEAEVVDDAPQGGVLPVRKKAATKTTGAAAKAAGAKATGTKATGTKAAGAKTTLAKASPAKSAKAGGTKVAGGRPPTARPGGGGGKNRKPLAPVRVSQGRNWGPILMFVGAGVVAVLIVGFGAFQVIKRDNQPSWQDRANSIDGIHNYLVSNPDWFKYDPNVGNHQAGTLSYPLSPPVGGVHNPHWQNCMGDVYTAQIPTEQAVHSMEHGAVWVTYRPDLPQDQIDQLASKVRDVEFMLMSPYPGLDQPISLQAWGYQLKLEKANDGRIDEFINALRKNTTQEPTAGCSGGYTDPGTVPLDLPGS
jgi:Protein of unknown function (DUF3105)